MGFDKFEQYLALPEISIKYGTAMQLIRVYKKFVIELQLPKDEIMTIDYYKLDTIVPVVNKQKYKDLLTEAKELTRIDLRKRIKEKYKNIYPAKESNKLEKTEIHEYRPTCPYWDGYRCTKDNLIQVDKDEWY